MSKKKKVFIIAYVIILMAVATFMLNKIFAAGNSTTSQGDVDTGKYAGKKLEGKETEATTKPANIDGVNFGEINIQRVENWAKGTDRGNIGRITWNLLIGNNDVFCLNKDKRMLNENNVMNQYIRKVTSVSMVGHKNGTDFATVPVTCTVYPTNGSWVSSSSIPYATYASLIFNWDKLAVKHQTQEDFGMSAAYVFAHRNEYPNKSDGTYTDAQHALWAVLKGDKEASGIDNDVNDDNIQSLITIKDLRKQISAIEDEIDVINININNCEREINTRQNNIDQYNDRIMELEEEKRNASEYRQQEIQREIERYEGYILNYETQIETYETQIEGFKTQIDNKNKEIETKKEEIQVQEDLLKNVSGANGLIIKALAFEQYRDEFKVPSLVDSNGNHEFKYVKNGDYFIAGPIKIKYPSLKTAVGEVVGIIDTNKLKLEGKTDDGTIKNIDRSQFEITDKNGQKIDFAEDGINFEFYLKVNNKAIKDNKIKYITDFTIKFKYMNITADGYKIYDPDGKVLEYYEWERKSQEVETSSDCEVYCSECEQYRYIYCTDSSDTYDDCPYCGKSYCRITHSHDMEYQLKRKSSPSAYAELQPIFICGNAEIFWEEYELKITFKPDNGLPTFIDLGGKVWVDGPMDEGKVIDNADGIFNGEDWGRENVLVELFFFDKTPVKVGVKDVIADKRNTKLINGANGNYAVYTDKDGNYMFYGLPVDQNYYVRFTYDGQTYTITKYLAGGSEADYKNNPNDSKYDDNSKVKDETERDAFNKKFEKITYVFSDIGKRNGTGQALGTSPFLKYLDKKYTESGVDYIKSKIITTDNNRDAEYGETGGPTTQTGKAIDPFKIQARTAEALKYPFEKNGEILIYSTSSEYTGLKGNALHYLQHINLGLKFRQRADFQLSTQLKAGATTIKDKEKVVIYPQSAKKENLDKDMDFTRQEDEYIKQEISAADYNWRAKFTEIYGDNGQEITGYVDEDKLNVYVLYRIAIKNQCEDAGDSGIINEIIDYYDNRLERVPESEIARASRLFREAGLNVPEKDWDSWIEDKNTQVIWTGSSKVGNYIMMTTNTEIPVAASNSETAIYLMLKVKDNGEVLNTGTDRSERDGMQNIAEIGSYTVKNGDKVVGKIDKDSAPGNAIPGNKSTYEDDTDASPMFRLEINWTPKEIKGTVWDDAREVNGTKDAGEFGIENVTVKLVEHIVKKDAYGNYIVTAEVERPGIELGYKTISVDPNQCVKTNQKGEYRFYVEGGNYSLKFIYGNKEMLYEFNENGTENKNENKIYNGQDYQATNYTPLSSGVSGYITSDNKLKAFATNSDLETAYENFLVVGQVDADPVDDLSWWNTNWNISGIFGKQPEVETDKWGLNSKYNKSSNARDKATIRADIIENTQKLTYSNASVLDKLNSGNTLSIDDAKTLSGDNTVNKLYDNNGNCTYMEAVSDIITIASNDLITEPNVINLGLKERPQASRQLEKQVDRIILTASDGTVLVDTGDNTKQSGLQKIDGIQQTFINLEPTLMDGAKLDIYYSLKITNDSTKDDRLDNYVYVRNPKKKVTRGHLQNNDEDVLDDLAKRLNSRYDRFTDLPIKATVFDYVNINLEYRAEDDNNGAIWTKVYEESGNTGNSVNDINSGWLSAEASARIKRDQKYVSKVLQTDTNKVDKKYRGEVVSGNATDGLLAGESVTIPLHLGITLSEDTSGKNLTDYDFSNCAELTQIVTSAGRRDYDTVPGDYVPYERLNKDNPDKDKQADAFLTGTTAITPPLGEGRFYYVIAIVSATIILVGIVLIKKKVLKK